MFTQREGRFCGIVSDAVYPLVLIQKGGKLMICFQQPIKRPIAAAKIWLQSDGLNINEIKAQCIWRRYVAKILSLSIQKWEKKSRDCY